MRVYCRGEGFGCLGIWGQGLLRAWCLSNWVIPYSKDSQATVLWDLGLQIRHKVLAQSMSLLLNAVRALMITYSILGVHYYDYV